MKIAHINNISGIASVIADYQRKQGYEVDVYVFNKKNLQPIWWYWLTIDLQYLDGDYLVN